MLTITGRGPWNRAGGLYRIPEIVRPSKDFQRMISGGGNTDASNVPVELSVQRVASSLPGSIEKTSANLATER